MEIMGTSTFWWILNTSDESFQGKYNTKTLWDSIPSYCVYVNSSSMIWTKQTSQCSHTRAKDSKLIINYRPKMLSGLGTQNLSMFKGCLDVRVQWSMPSHGLEYADVSNAYIYTICTNSKLRHDTFSPSLHSILLRSVIRQSWVG